MRLSQPKTSFVSLAFLLLLSSLVISYIYFTNLNKTQSKTEPDMSFADVVQIGEQKVVIPSWKLFEPGEMWSLVNPARPISPRYSPPVVDSPIPFSGENMKVGQSVTHPLTALSKQAQADGINLMLSSGYRSSEDQKNIYDSYLFSHGESYAKNYVANPGISEHQTGLAVDIASLSEACKHSGYDCSLTPEAIAWLRANAPSFGFIERFPAGKQSITGVVGEHWHYRYVGVPLAKALTASGTTLDEFVIQTAPGYAK